LEHEHAVRWRGIKISSRINPGRPTTAR
jgi:hypothetical protein